MLNHLPTAEAMRSVPDSRRDESLEAVPDWLLIDLKAVFIIFDELSRNKNLPPIHVDEIMPTLIKLTLDRRWVGIGTYAAQLDALTEGIFRYAEPEEFEFAYAYVRHCIDTCAVLLGRQLRAMRLYVRGFFPYHYVGRKHCNKALLHRK